jgi:hypothetical protein
MKYGSLKHGFSSSCTLTTYSILHNPEMDSILAANAAARTTGTRVPEFSIEPEPMDLPPPDFNLAPSKQGSPPA